MCVLGMSAECKVTGKLLCSLSSTAVAVAIGCCVKLGEQLRERDGYHQPALAVHRQRAGLPTTNTPVHDDQEQLPGLIARTPEKCTQLGACRAAQA